MKNTQKDFNKTFLKNLANRDKSQEILEKLLSECAPTEIFVAMLEASLAKVVYISSYQQILELKEKIGSSPDSKVTDSNAQVSCVHLRCGIAESGALWVDKQNMVELEVSGNFSITNFVIDQRNIDASFNSSKGRIGNDDGYFVSGPKTIFPEFHHFIRNLERLTVYVLCINDYPVIFSAISVCPICFKTLS